MFRLMSRNILSNHNFNIIGLGYSTKTNVKDKIDKLVKGNKVVVFMKGTKEQPKCGFSNAVVQILNFHGVKDFSDQNVLADEELRNGVKEFTDWPTIPQVFINGEFMGGADVMMDMHKSGDLIAELQKAGIRSILLDKP